MVWATQDSAEDVVLSVDSVKAKPLKKRCTSRAGLSRYYSSKSQSFSSIDLVQCTPFGTSALALAKRPSSFDLRRHGGSSSPRASAGRCSALAAAAMCARGCMEPSTSFMSVTNEEEDSAAERCPCNDTIFTDPTEAFVSPEGSPSGPSCLEFEDYSSCGGGLTAVVTAAAEAQADAAVQLQCQALANDYISQLSYPQPCGAMACSSGSSLCNNSSSVYYCSTHVSSSHIRGAGLDYCYGGGLPSRGSRGPGLSWRGSSCPAPLPMTVACSNSGSGGGATSGSGRGAGQAAGDSALGACTSRHQPWLQGSSSLSVPPSHAQGVQVAVDTHAAALSPLQTSCSSDLNNNTSACDGSDGRPSPQSFLLNNGLALAAATAGRSRSCYSAGGAYPTTADCGGSSSSGSSFAAAAAIVTASSIVTIPSASSAAAVASAAGMSCENGCVGSVTGSATALGSSTLHPLLSRAGDFSRHRPLHGVAAAVACGASGSSSSSMFGSTEDLIAALSLSDKHHHHRPHQRHGFSQHPRNHHTSSHRTSSNNASGSSSQSHVPQLSRHRHGSYQQPQQLPQSLPLPLPPLPLPPLQLPLLPLPPLPVAALPGTNSAGCGSSAPLLQGQEQGLLPAAATGAAAAAAAEAMEIAEPSSSGIASIASITINSSGGGSSNSYRGVSWSSGGGGCSSGSSNGFVPFAGVAAAAGAACVGGGSGSCSSSSGQQPNLMWAVGSAPSSSPMAHPNFLAGGSRC